MERDNANVFNREIELINNIFGIDAKFVQTN